MKKPIVRASAEAELDRQILVVQNEFIKRRGKQEPVGLRPWRDDAQNALAKADGAKIGHVTFEYVDHMRELIDREKRR